jgi:hypothetical protein
MDFHEELHQLFDAHDDAIRALRSANKAIGDAIQAHDQAIEAALAANRAALKLLARLEGRE